MGKTIEKKVLVGELDLAFSFDEGCAKKMIDAIAEAYRDLMVEKRPLLMRDNSGTVKNFVFTRKGYAIEIHLNKKKRGKFSKKAIFYGEIIEKGPNGPNKIGFYENYNPNA